MSVKRLKTRHRASDAGRLSRQIALERGADRAGSV
jgi:hypothetical protein